MNTVAPVYRAYNLGHVSRLRQRLQDRVFVPRYHATPEGHEFDLLCRDLAKELEHVRKDTVRETARQLLGQELTPARCKFFCWLLAGNLWRLREGQTVLPWTPDGLDEWVPVQFTRCEKQRNTRGDIGYLYQMRVQAGRPSGLIVQRFWSERYVAAASRRIGFTPPWRKFPFSHGAQWVGLQLYAKVEGKHSRERPQIHELHCPGSCKTYNTTVLKGRFKLDPPCMNGWTHPCHVCAVGAEACEFATHARTFVARFCDRCLETVPFDPESSSPVCVVCTAREALRTPTH